MRWTGGVGVISSNVAVSETDRMCFVAMGQGPKSLRPVVSNEVDVGFCINGRSNNTAPTMKRRQRR